MENYPIKTLIDLSGVTRKRLRHYSRLGLVKPNEKINPAKWTYSKLELIRLLQILCFKEFDFTLEEIDSMINDTNLDIKKTLNVREKKLRNKNRQAKELILIINKKVVKARAHREARLRAASNVKKVQTGIDDAELERRQNAQAIPQL